VEPLDRRSNPAPDEFKSQYLPLIISGAESLHLRSKEHCLYPSDSFVLHVWKHVSIGIQREGRAGVSELLRDNFR